MAGLWSDVALMRLVSVMTNVAPGGSLNFVDVTGGYCTSFPPMLADVRENTNFCDALQRTEDCIGELDSDA